MVIELEYNSLANLDWQDTNRLCSCPSCSNSYFKQTARYKDLVLFLEDCIYCGYGGVYTNNPDIELECIYNPFFKG